MISSRESSVIGRVSHDAPKFEELTKIKVLGLFKFSQEDEAKEVDLLKHIEYNHVDMLRTAHKNVYMFEYV